MWFKPCSLQYDPVLSLINSRLDALRTNPHSTGSASITSSGGVLRPASSQSSGVLVAEMQQWEVQWEHLELDRLIGGGSFGRVSLRLPFVLACFSFLRACDMTAGGVGLQLHSGADVWNWFSFRNTYLGCVPR